MGFAHTIGSHWMDFDDTALAYPTDGKGGSGSGSLTTASHLRDANEWIIDGLIVLTNAAGATWTLKDASETTLWAIPIPSGKAVGDRIDLGFQVNSAAGFTMESSAAGCTGTISYRIVRNTPS